MQRQLLHRIHRCLEHRAGLVVGQFLRLPAPGIEGAEGHPHAHEVLKPEIAIKYLEQRDAKKYAKAIEMLKTAKPVGARVNLTFRIVR